MASTAPEVHSDALSAPLDGPAASADAGPPQAPAVPDAPAPKRKSVKRKSAKDIPLSKEEPQEGLKPLPEDASGTLSSS